MIASLLMTFCAAFNPVRGSSMQRLDSSLTIDSRTIQVSASLPAVVGGKCSYIVDRPARDSAIALFPGNPYGIILGQTSSMGPMPPGFPTIKLFQTPDSSRRFVLNGATAKWAVWADTLTALDTLRSTPDMHRLSTRWRWSKIDTGIAWTAWLRKEESSVGVERTPLPAMSAPSTSRTGAFDPATGRRVPAGEGLTPGMHLVATTSGLRMILVR